MNRTHGWNHWDPENCFGCRVRTVNLQTDDFVPHYNWSVGKYVNNQTEFNDALKRCGEDQSIRTGLEHNYQPRQPDEQHHTEEGLANRDKVIQDKSVELRVKDRAFICP